MFGTWYQATMLMMEANNVIGLRLLKISAGGEGAITETRQMVNEKISAAAEAFGTLCAGGSPETVMQRYRQHVAANERRLSGE